MSGTQDRWSTSHYHPGAEKDVSADRHEGARSEQGAQGECGPPQRFCNLYPKADRHTLATIVRSAHLPLTAHRQVVQRDSDVLIA